MKAFAALYAALDETTGTNDKLAAMAAYFRAAPPADAAWAVYFLTGRRIKRLVQAPRLRAWAREAAGVPEWLFDECFEAVGDLAETIALLVPGDGQGMDLPLSAWVEERIMPLRGASEEQQRTELLKAWRELGDTERFVLGKLITGEFRVGVSQRLVVRAMAQACGLDAAVISHRLMGTWTPSGQFYLSLLDRDTADAGPSRPYPFFLSYPLESPPEQLGDLSGWQAEWKWDGIRAQVIRRAGQAFIWSRGEDLVTDRFPEVESQARALPDGTVLDGELLAWREGRPLPFLDLQQRIGRKSLTKKLMADVPVIFMAYDLLELDARDIRDSPLRERRAELERLLSATGLSPSPLLHASSWAELAEAREQSRDRRVEGLMLKRLASPYRAGRQRGDWWKWKIAPYSIDAVLIYAQRGHGRRASLYTDYTFAVWDGDALVPFAKAYSGLTDEEIRRVDAFVRNNTLSRFGPVRSVRPALVFEIAFEHIQRSSRHKSGIAVRFPRILRWRPDKRPEDADTLDTIQGLLPSS